METPLTRAQHIAITRRALLDINFEDRLVQKYIRAAINRLDTIQRNSTMWPTPTEIKQGEPNT